LALRGLERIKAFFSEEKKQKTFGLWRMRSPGHVRQSQKVFWFFFSKKNSLPYRVGAVGLGEAGAGSRGGIGMRCGVGAGRPITKSKDMGFLQRVAVPYRCYAPGTSIVATSAS
jgi:hypothetical protein